jgi:hypothetical protein
MKINRIDVLVGSLIVLVGVYLFVQAPKGLEVKKEAKGERIPVKILFDMVAHENNVVRTLWTKKIVVAGKDFGLKFHEDWRNDKTEAGPLPALFLREVSKHLEKNAIPLSLFLGSDFPIASVNKFEGIQVNAYKKMKKTKKPQYFYDVDIKRQTAMYPDYATARACVTCHNEHDDSPKTDWKYQDMMGATTWSYPKEYVTRDELFVTLEALRSSFGKAYSSFLEKTKTYEVSPTIGKIWPEDAFAIPSLEVFSERSSHLSSRGTIDLLLKKSK